MKTIASRALLRRGFGRNVITFGLLLGALVMIGAAVAELRLDLSELPQLVEYTLKSVAGPI